MKKVTQGALTLGHLAVAVFTPNWLKSASVSVASLARPGQFGHLGEVCCYGTGRYGTDANEPTRAH